MSKKELPRYMREPFADKQIRAGGSPTGGKIPRVGGDPGNSNSLNPVWAIGIFDKDGPWGTQDVTLEVLLGDIFLKLRHYESMTWSDIERDRDHNHSVEIGRLIKEARGRIDDLHLDVDELFRFRLNGKQRIWGIRSINVFHILWWDPDHEICPSTKRHT